MNHKWLSLILLLIALTHYSWGEELRDTWTLSNEEATEAYDEQGDKVWSRQLNIYGETRRESGEKNFIPFLYQGQYFDEETELAYNRYRYYSPETGLYVSQDPIGIDANQPNFYAYVEDVNRWLDPYGLSCSAAKNKKTVYNVSSRRDAFRQAKRDANVPVSQKPTKIEKPVLEDGYGKPVMKDGQPVTFREYHFKNNKGETVVIQEHSLGHTKATPQHGLEPHFNTRELDSTGNVKGTGSFPGTHGHYNF